ncbi:probable rRNA-processing protein EBP2 [Exaiptasia diaphana]|uniref:Uncharacterized protein n=1 Tax=Exaiptasia diaphana TaxID=2652724 RepID=A0A913X9B7_EXADI|nr:probable rRNA-processing protein EBP2 [Exaiptasia diaphana]KXJ26681.1 putative rRNA-processing protein EBP2 [Exaiptasia diaphana]
MASKLDEEMFESSESDDSDTELQKAFMRGELKVGLNRPAFVPRAQRPSINNVEGIKQKLEHITKNLDWIETMDVIFDGGEEEKEEENNNTTEVHDDFKREMRFYKQAQHAVTTAIPRLHSLGVKTNRPEDYFAEMVKTDEHMQRVRAKLLSKQQGIERSDKMKKLREMKKFGKKVQQDVLQKRQKEKKEMIESVKKYRKGNKQAAPEFMKDDDFDINTEKEKKKSQGKSNKRKAKDKKFGHGGKKRGLKHNTKSSSADVSSFNSRKHSKAPRLNQPGKKRKAQRPGKSRRKKMKK